MAIITSSKGKAAAVGTRKKELLFSLLYLPVPCCSLNGRVKKRAMTSFERDRMMSKMSAQLDYKVH